MTQTNTITPQVKYLLMLAMIVTGTLNTITYKFQNTTKVYEKGYPANDHIRTFFHPYMQAVAMFTGEALCMILFIVWKWRNREEYERGAVEAAQRGLETRINYWQIMIPASADLITSTLQHIALVYIQASIYQMVRGGVIVINAIGSVLFLRRVLYRSHKLGCALVVLGILIVGLQNLLINKSNSEYSATEQTVSLLLIFVSLFTDSVRYLYEELLFRKYYLHTYQLVGIEGCWGLLMYAVLMPILCNVYCPFGLSGCVYYPTSTPHFESFVGYFVEAAESGFLASMCFVGVISILLFNISGVTVTKNISALVRSLVDVTRTSVVWLVCLILTVTDVPALQESTKPLSICLELLGFGVMILGNLTYQQIILWPCFRSEGRQEDIVLDNDDEQKAKNSAAGISLMKNETADSEFSLPE